MSALFRLLITVHCTSPNNCNQSLFFLSLADMKARVKNKKPGGQAQASTAYLASNVPTYTINFHSSSSTPRTETHYVPVPAASVPQPIFGPPLDEALHKDPSLPFLDASTTAEDVAGSIPAYDTTAPSGEKAEKIRQTVAHMEELKAEQAVFLQILLSLHYGSQIGTPCVCGGVRAVACSDCLQAPLLCRQCWLNKHRTMPTHWALIWDATKGFFEKHDFCRVKPNTAVGLGHSGERCPNAGVAQPFTLVDSNGIHATAMVFCGCKTNGKLTPRFQQLLHAGVFPGSVKEPKTGYTLGLLEYYRQQRNQGKGSAHNFVLVLQRLADPFFAGSVPDIYANFLAITRFHEYLDIIMRRGHAHGLDEPLPGETDRPYPNRPVGYLGLRCAACPERGVNMPLQVKYKKYLRHLVSEDLTYDGNYKANLFCKRDDGSDKALTDGAMYFPNQKEYDRVVKEYVIPEEDKEVPCKAHIGSIRHQGSVKYGNTAVSGVIAAACGHAVAGSFVDMIKGEAFALVTYAQREYLRHTNSPPHGPESATPMVSSYDSYCSFVVHQVKRAIDLFPDETWLHDLLKTIEGQIPADHINGHGARCQAIWQAVYFACRAHFHGETAEVLWAFLNPLGSSTRQMTGAARHDTMNFVVDAWNTSKVLRQAELLAAERLDALQLFELHMAVVEDLSKQHATKVGDWSRMSRITTVSDDGVIQSVYQHRTTTVLTVENTLAAMVAEERERQRHEDGESTTTSVAGWLAQGMKIQRDQALVIALLGSHKEHPLQDTWEAITKLRDSLNIDLKNFREHQRLVYPRLNLSALDVDEPELTAIQLPSYRMKHKQRGVNATNATGEDLALQEAEIRLRCSSADNGILRVQDASLALSAVKKARDLDYRGQNGKTRTQRNLQKAELMKTFEIAMYNQARDALIHLGHMGKDDVEPYRPLTHRDTRRKETHLHRAKGDSRLFDGTAWYLQSGERISEAAVRTRGSDDTADSSEDDEPILLAGTQTLKRKGFAKSKRPPKRLKDIAPDDVTVDPASMSEAEDSDPEMSPSKPKQANSKKGQSKPAKKPEGWIWFDSLTRGRDLGDDTKLAKYKEESDQVQWHRAEAEMYRWLEQYERKHAELFRVIERFCRDSAVWTGQGDREEKENGLNGAVAFARMQAAMYKRLEHNAKAINKSKDSGAHHDWVTATSFDDLVDKIDGWRDVVFKWMDDMGIYRAYKDF
ncbi:hypothetical protein DFH06DRAFT_759654 [Mycena polygramma]|nr:hypothetical protein DFH06DRAFT_759654 [Mycena polygramma]